MPILLLVAVIAALALAGQGGKPTLEVSPRPSRQSLASALAKAKASSKGGAQSPPPPSSAACKRPSDWPQGIGAITGSGPSERSFQDSSGAYIPTLRDAVRYVRDTAGVAPESGSCATMIRQIESQITAWGFSFHAFQQAFDAAADSGKIYAVGRLRDAAGGWDWIQRYASGEIAVDCQYRRDWLHSWRRALWIWAIYKVAGCV